MTTAHAEATKLKVCCIASLDEARLAIRLGADAIGLVSAMPSGPGPIDETAIAAIAPRVPPPTRTFLLTALTDVEAIAAQHARCGRPTTLQLVDHVAHAELRALQAALPGVELVQVVHVVGEASLDEAHAAAPFVDALLLDSGNPALAVKQLGGTGRVHDWALSARIRDALAPLPLWLAGGLHAGNVAAAIDAVRPHGVDLCSRVRTDGRLDARKLEALVAALRGRPMNA